MSDRSTRFDDEEQRAARLTALVLDELDGEERAKVEAELESAPGDRQAHDELTQIAAALQARKWDESPRERAASLRTAVLERLSATDRGVELPPSRKTLPLRRWAAVIAVSAALLLLAIPLHRAMQPATRVSTPSWSSQPGAVRAVTLTEAKSTTLSESANMPVIVRREGEDSAELARIQTQFEQGVVTYDEGKPAENLTYRELPPEVLEQIRQLNASNADWNAITAETNELGAEIKLVQQGHDSKFSTIVAATDESRGERAEFFERWGRVVREGEKLPNVVAAAPADATIGQAAAESKATPEMLAAQPVWGTPYSAAQPPASPPLGWRAEHIKWDDGYWRQLDFDGDGLPDPVALGQTVDQNTLLAKHASEAKPESESRKKGSAVIGASDNEQYAPIVENQFAAVTDKPISTFSIDVDTASYANVRRFLTQNQLPPPNAVRLEELINYFSYSYPQPEGEDPFSVSMEVAQCPWQPVHKIVRIGLKGKDVPRKKRPASSLVFLLDVSGSMQDANKLPLLKQAMKLLTDQLTENDRVTIVTYAGNAGLALDTTNGENKETIRAAIDALNANGSTNGSAGIQLAYEKATQAFVKEGANRVILATDGDLNVGVTEDGDLVKLITEKARSGVFLTVLGFGEGNLKDGKLEKLADNGNGMYAYVDSLREARKVLVEQISGSLVTIAKDVKIKVEFNPAEVAGYRLLGYENRLMTAAEFNDDKKDAGEIGAGHTVTAMYEIVPRTAKPKLTAAEGELKYQREPAPAEPPKELTEAAKTGELLTLYLRYKLPDADESTLREAVVENQQRAFDEASADFRFAAAVASFGMQLRNSKFRGSTSFAAIEETAASAIGDDPQGHRTEFVDLVRRASELVSRRGK